MGLHYLRAVRATPSTILRLMATSAEIGASLQHRQAHRPGSPHPDLRPNHRPSADGIDDGASSLTQRMAQCGSHRYALPCTRARTPMDLASNDRSLRTQGPHLAHRAPTQPPASRGISHDAVRNCQRRFQTIECRPVGAQRRALGTHCACLSTGFQHCAARTFGAGNWPLATGRWLIEIALLPQSAPAKLSPANRGADVTARFVCPARLSVAGECSSSGP